MAQRKKKTKKVVKKDELEGVELVKDGLINTGKRVRDDLYYKWRLTIEERDHAKTRALVQQLRVELKQHELNMCKMKLQKHYEAMTACGVEYDKVKSEIEVDLGISISDCLIDEYTFEVKKIEQPKN